MYNTFQSEENYTKITSLLKVNNKETRIASMDVLVQVFLLLTLIFDFLIANFLHTSQHLLVQSQQWKHQNNVGNLFKFNNKDIITMSSTSLWCLYCYLWTNFTYWFTVSIADFEKVNAGTSRRRSFVCFY